MSNVIPQVWNYKTCGILNMMNDYAAASVTVSRGSAAVVSIRFARRINSSAGESSRLEMLMASFTENTLAINPTAGPPITCPIAST